MKKSIMAALALAVLMMLALAGCSDDGDQKITAEQVKKEAKEAVDTAVAYSKQKHEEYMNKAKAKYQEWEQESAQLMEQAKQKAAQGQAKAQEALADLQAKQEVVKQKWEALKTSTGEAYVKAKQELEEALKNLQEAYNKAKAELAG